MEGRGGKLARREETASLCSKINPSRTVAWAVGPERTLFWLASERCKAGSRKLTESSSSCSQSTTKALKLELVSAECKRKEK